MNPDRSAAVARMAEMIAAVDVSHPIRVAIDGLMGSGKTMLADDLAPAIRVRGHPCIRATMDGFHRPAADRHAKGRRSAEGYYRDAFDLDAVQGLLLEPLGPGGDRRYQTAARDLDAGRPIVPTPRQADRKAVLLMDGMFLQRPELADSWEFVVWVDCEEERARARAVARDRGAWGPEVDALYRERYLPAQRLYVDDVDPAERADVRFVNNDPDHPILAVRR